MRSYGLDSYDLYQEVYARVVQRNLAAFGESLNSNVKERRQNVAKAAKDLYDCLESNLKRIHGIQKYNQAMERLNNYARGKISIPALLHHPNALSLSSVVNNMEYHENKVEWSYIITWAEKTSDMVFKITNAQRHLAADSERKNSLPERWYLLYAKALYNTEDFKQSANIALQGWQNYPHNLWLKRQYSLACARLNNLDRAIEIHSQLASEIDEWYVHHELATFYLQKNSWTQAKRVLTFAFQPKYAVSKLEYQWRLFFDATLILSANTDFQVASLHALTALTLYSGGYRSIRDLLKGLVNLLSINYNFSYLDSNTILSFIFNYWQNEMTYLLPARPDADKELPLLCAENEPSQSEGATATSTVTEADQQGQTPDSVKKEQPDSATKPQEGDSVYTGRIKTILKHGKAGFIGSAHGEDYYFKIADCQDRGTMPKIGDRVRFKLRKAYDPVKRRDSQRAVEVEILPSNQDKER